MSILYSREELTERAKKYAAQLGLNIARSLGHGTQGIVFESAQNTAVKVHARYQGYRQERDVYLRLKEKNIFKACGLNIPRITNWSDELLVLEISIVQPPFLLDFGGAYLDYLPEHASASDEWRQEKIEQFGEKWEAVQAVLRELAFIAGVFIADVNPGNIRFGGTSG